MATSRRPSRPGRPASASARRRPPADEELAEGEEGDLEDAPPPPKGPSVTMIVGLGAALLFAILLIMLISSKRGFLVEIENMSENPLQKVSVKINGVTYEIGDMRPNEIGGAQAKCSPGSDVEVDYTVPNRGPFVRKLPRGSDPYAPDFVDFKGRFRIRLQPEGIKETEY